jgi:myo-inositol-1(or 4)-monophosphatase
MLDYKSICFQAIELIKTTGAFVKESRKKLTQTQIYTKGIHDYVTQVDRESEIRLVSGLQKILPDSGFIAEEGTSDIKADVYNWVIDPIDGTTNFIHNVPLYAISVALMEKDKVVIGIVYEINLEECFYAFGENKAYLNGNEIVVSATADLENSLVATGFPYQDYGKLKEYMLLFEYLMQHSRGLRRLGSAAVDLAYVAAGRFDAFYEYGLSPWDVAAGAFLVEQAGGKVTDFSKSNNYIFGKEIISSNALIFEEITIALDKFFHHKT